MVEMSEQAYNVENAIADMAAAVASAGTPSPGQPGTATGYGQKPLGMTEAD